MKRLFVLALLLAAPAQAETADAALRRRQIRRVDQDRSGARTTPPALPRRRARSWPRRPRAISPVSIVWSAPKLTPARRSPPTPNCRTARSISRSRSVSRNTSSGRWWRGCTTIRARPRTRSMRRSPPIRAALGCWRRWAAGTSRSSIMQAPVWPTVFYGATVKRGLEQLRRGLQDGAGQHPPALSVRAHAVRLRRRPLPRRDRGRADQGRGGQGGHGRCAACCRSAPANCWSC